MFTPWGRQPPFRFYLSLKEEGRRTLLCLFESIPFCITKPAYSSWIKLIGHLEVDWNPKPGIVIYEWDGEQLLEAAPISEAAQQVVEHVAEEMFASTIDQDLPDIGIGHGYAPRFHNITLVTLMAEQSAAEHSAAAPSLAREHSLTRQNSTMSTMSTMSTLGWPVSGISGEITVLVPGVYTGPVVELPHPSETDPASHKRKNSKNLLPTKKQKVRAADAPQPIGTWNKSLDTDGGINVKNLSPQINGAQILPKPGAATFPPTHLVNKSLGAMLNVGPGQIISPLIPESVEGYSIQSAFNLALKFPATNRPGAISEKPVKVGKFGNAEGGGFSLNQTFSGPGDKCYLELMNGMLSELVGLFVQLFVTQKGGEPFSADDEKIFQTWRTRVALSMRLRAKETKSFPPPSTDGAKGGFVIKKGEMSYVKGKKDKHGVPACKAVGQLRPGIGEFYIQTFFIMAGTHANRPPRDFDVLRKFLYKVYYDGKDPLVTVTAQCVRDFIATMNEKMLLPDPNWEGLGVHFFTFMAELLELADAEVRLFA